MRTPLVLALGLVACTPAPAERTPDESRGDETAGSEGDHALPDRCAGACAEGELCERDHAWRCSCVLVYDRVCGGAYREPDPPTWGWACEPRDPTTDRGDGCPFGLPEEGRPCSPEGRRCEYATDGCGWTGTVTVCAGSWHHEAYAYPPPP